MSIHKYINSPYSANTQHFQHSENVSSLQCCHKSMSKQVFSLKKKMCFCIVMFISVPGSGMIQSQMQDTFFFQMVGSLLKKQQHERDVDSGTMHCFTNLVHFASHFFEILMRSIENNAFFSYKCSSSCAVLCLGVTVRNTELAQPIPFTFKLVLILIKPICNLWPQIVYTVYNEGSLLGPGDTKLLFACSKKGPNTISMGQIIGVLRHPSWHIVYSTLHNLRLHHICSVLNITH